MIIVVVVVVVVVLVRQTHHQHPQDLREDRGDERSGGTCGDDLGLQPVGSHD